MSRSSNLVSSTTELCSRLMNTSEPGFIVGSHLADLVQAVATAVDRQCDRIEGLSRGHPQTEDLGVDALTDISAVLRKRADILKALANILAATDIEIGETDLLQGLDADID
jgi:hypothetical protein